MSSGKSNIKKFTEFKPVKKNYKMMNRLYIKGNLPGSFWVRKEDFEIMIVFTGLKRLIIDIVLLEGNVSLNDKRFNFDFKIGDNINVAREWVEKNGHFIDIEIIRHEI